MLCGQEKRENMWWWLRVSEKTHESVNFELGFKGSKNMPKISFLPYFTHVVFCPLCAPSSKLTLNF